MNSSQDIVSGRFNPVIPHFHAHPALLAIVGRIDAGWALVLMMAVQINKQRLRNNKVAADYRYRKRNGILAPSRKQFTDDELKEHVAEKNRRYNSRPEIKEKNEAYRRNRIQEQRAYDAARYASHRKDILAARAKFRSENVEKFRQSLRNDYAKHKERRLAYAKRIRTERAKELRAERREKYRTDPSKAIARTAARRAIKTSIPLGELKVIEKWSKTWRTKKRVRCYWCGKTIRGRDGHADHINPLKLSGVHEIKNLCISCITCNTKKSAKPLAEWNARLAQPVLL